MSIVYVAESPEEKCKDYFCSKEQSDRIILSIGKEKNNYDADVKESFNNGDFLLINDSQCALIVENGKVVDICDMPGFFQYDATSKPSVLSNSFGGNVKNMFPVFGKKYSPRNLISKQKQYIYFLNRKKLSDISFYTLKPLEINNLFIDCDVSFSISVCDPVIFYSYYAKRIDKVFTISDIEKELTKEFGSAVLKIILDYLDEKNVLVSNYFDEKDFQEFISSRKCYFTLLESLHHKWQEEKGIMLRDVNKSNIKIKKREVADNSACKTTYIGQPVWKCPRCGQINDRQYCVKCGHEGSFQSLAPAWICPVCGARNTGSFCGDCGARGV